jgi:NADH dehydrogenase FAD-containing subunit
MPARFATDFSRVILILSFPSAPGADHRDLGFETAYLPTTSVETKKQLLNFAIVGGGPTGIEFSAELHDLVTEDMAKIYPELMQYSRITVYDVADKVLTMFDDKLATYALDHFKREGIHVRTCHHVKSLRRGSPNQQLGDNSSNDLANCYTLDTKEDGQVGVGMVVWSTGLMANPFIQKSLATPHSLPRKSAAFEISQQPADGNEKWRIATNPRNGGIMTNDRLRVLMQPPFSSSASTTNPQDTRTTGTNNTINTNNRAIINNVFALGDCAVIEHTTLPATGQVADQQARWLAKRLNAHDMDKPSTQGFAYKDLGVMAYVGSWKAIVQTKPADVSGRTAWFMWRGAYLAKSMSWRNRILILIYW